MRLWQRLFLAFAALSGLALFAFVAWQQQNFRRGFLSYLDEVTLQRLEPARARLTAAYAEHGNWDFLRNDPASLGELIEPGPGAMRRLRENASADSSMRAPPGERIPPHSAGEPRSAPPLGRTAGGRRRRPRRLSRPRSASRSAAPAWTARPDVAPAADRCRRRAGRGQSRNPAANALALPLLLDDKPVGTLRLARQSQINAAVDLAFSTHADRRRADRRRGDPDRRAGAGVRAGALAARAGARAGDRHARARRRRLRPARDDRAQRRTRRAGARLQPARRDARTASRRAPALGRRHRARTAHAAERCCAAKSRRCRMACARRRRRRSTRCRPSAHGSAI